MSLPQSITPKNIIGVSCTMRSISDIYNDISFLDFDVRSRLHPKVIDVECLRSVNACYYRISLLSNSIFHMMQIYMM